MTIIILPLIAVFLSGVPCLAETEQKTNPIYESGGFAPSPDDPEPEPTPPPPAPAPTPTPTPEPAPAPPPVIPNVDVFPQIVFGGGWEVVLFLTNNGEKSKNVEPQLRRQGQSPLQSNWHVNGRTFAARQELLIPVASKATVKLTLMGGEEMEEGYLAMDRDDDIASAVFYRLKDTNAELVDTVGVPPSRGGVAFRFPVEKSANVNTGMAIVTLLDSPILVEATLYDERGTVFGRQNVVVSGHAAGFVDEVMPDVPDDFVGTLELAEPSGNLFVLVLRMDQTPAGPQFTTIPAVRVK